MALPVGVAVVTYLLALLGPLLDLPSTLVQLSPFAGLPPPPDTGASAGRATAVCGAGLLAAAGGVLAFVRRDVTGE